MIELISIVLALVASVFEARLTVPYLPDFTLSLLLFLFLRMDAGWGMVMAIIFGILRDGIDPSHIWLSPFLFSTYSFLASGLKSFVNINIRLIIFSYAVIITFVHKVILSQIYGVPLTWTSIIVSALFTGIIVTILFYLFPER